MIPFFDYGPEYRRHADSIAEAVRRVFHSGRLILGPEVEAFESEFARATGTAGAVGVGSGTDALVLALSALEARGGEVITVANAGVPPVAAIRQAGATPVFVDVEPHTLTLDPQALAAAIGPRTVCILAVHLYGQPAALDAMLDVAGKTGIPLVEDCAQAHGAVYHGRPVGSLGTFGCFSFYPTKNLGAYGDGGAVGYYFWHYLGMDRDAREEFRDSPYFDYTEEFCAKYDQTAFDPDYKSNPLDRGHVLRRLDTVWGDDFGDAKKANDDTFHWTNCSPQHKDFNQGHDLWLGIESHLLNQAIANNLKVSIFNGPVLEDDDPHYRDIQLPRAFWKVVAFVRDDGKLSASGYLLTQAEQLKGDLKEGVEGVFDDWNGFQVPIAEIERMTGLSFRQLAEHDAATSGDTESATPTGARPLRSFADLRI